MANSEITIGFKVVKGEHDPEITGIFSTYEHEFSRHPEKIRISFKDGSTAVYDLHTDQPHPLVLKNIEIMKETKKKIAQGYVNQPLRRRRRNRT